MMKITEEFMVEHQKMIMLKTILKMIFPIVFKVKLIH